MKIHLFVLTVLISAGVASAPMPNVSRTLGDVLRMPDRENPNGRLAIMCTVGDFLVTIPEVPGSQAGDSTNTRAWDISDPINPVEILDAGHTGQPFRAHGTIKTADGAGNECCFIGGFPNDAICEDGLGSVENVAFPENGFGALGNNWETGGMMRPNNATGWWSYNAVDGDLTYQLDSRPSLTPATWDHLTHVGVVGMPRIFGNLLFYVSDQTHSGAAVYDISNPEVPRLLDTLTDIGDPDHRLPTTPLRLVGGYWYELFEDKIVIASRPGENQTNNPEITVVDFSDPENLSISCHIVVPKEVNTNTGCNSADWCSFSDNMYVGFQDNYLFADALKINLDTCLIEETFEQQALSIDASQYGLPLGNVVAWGGYPTVTDPVGYNGDWHLRVHQAAPDTTPPTVGYHLPGDGQTTYPVNLPISLNIHENLRVDTITPSTLVFREFVSQTAVPYTFVFSHTGTLTVTPTSDLTPDTQYEVILDGIQDYMGNAMANYSYTFTTGTPAILGTSVFDLGSAPTPTPTPLPSPYIAKKSGQVVCNDSDVWAVNSDNSSITRLDTTGLSIQAEVKTLFKKPVSMASVNGYIAVAYANDDKIGFHDVLTGILRRSVSLDYGDQPAGIVSTADGNTLYIALYNSGEIARLNVSSLKVDSRIEVGPTPYALALTDDETRLLVTRLISGANETGQVYDIATAGNMTLTRTINVEQLTQRIDGLSDGNGLPNYLSGIVVNEAGTFAYVTANKLNIGRGQTLDGQLLDDDNTIRAMMATIDLTNNVDLVDEHFDFNNNGSPSDVTLSPDGNYIFASMQDSNVVVVLDTNLNLITTYDGDLAPQSLCVTSDRLYAKNFMSRNIWQYDIQPLIDSGTINPPIVTGSTVTNEVLDSTVLQGKRVFFNAEDLRMAPEGYMACVTCHLNGGHDGQTWDFTQFGEGMRNTPTLNGLSGVRFGNAHWSANFDEIQDFECQIEAFNGAGFSDTSDCGVSPLTENRAGQDNDLDALAIYVGSLGKDSLPRSPNKTRSGSMTESGLRGAAVFNELNCGGCHLGKPKLDGKVHNVGTITASSGQRLGATLQGIKTPPLAGIFASAPYFHDGSAPDLQSVLSSGTHDITSFTTVDEQNDLIEYLLQLDKNDFIEDADPFTKIPAAVMEADTGI